MIHHVCPRCQTPFTSRHSVSIYCSRRCSSLAREERLRPKVLCEHCQKQIIPYHVGQRFCSPECYKQARRNKSKHSAPFRTIYKHQCSQCGMEYESRRPDQKYCSETCQHDALRVFRHHTCQHCGKDFVRKRKDSQYCSKECRYAVSKAFKMVTCDYCKKQFARSSSYRKCDHVFCSRKCAALYRGSITPSRQVRLICTWCKQPYMRARHEASVSRFCSKSCKSNWMVQHMHTPTSIEIKVAQLLDSMKIRYEKEKAINKFLCDLFLCDYNLVIECDGVYWHSLPKAIRRDKVKDARLRDLGYTVLRLPEDKIRNDIAWCRKQILLSMTRATRHIQTRLPLRI